MDNYKIKVKDEAESKEAQELFVQLGYELDSFFGKYSADTEWVLACTDGSMGCASDGMAKDDLKEITFPQLRDLVVLKRNDVKDANYKLFISPRQGYLSLYKASNDVFYAYASKSKCWDESRAVDVNTKDLEPIDIDHASEEKDPALISGAEAKLAWANGEIVEYFSKSRDEWFEVKGNTFVSVFDSAEKLRIKPQTIKLELELPKPFEPKEGDTFYYLSDGEECGFIKCEHDWTFDPKELNFGAYRTEEEIKQVVEQLRKIQGTNS